MSLIHTRICSALTVLAILFLGGTANASNHDALKAALESKYQLTKTGIDRIRVTQPGTVFVLQKDGISGDLALDMSFLNNKIRDGQIAQAGGFMASMQGKTTSRDLKGRRNSRSL